MNEPRPASRLQPNQKAKWHRHDFVDDHRAGIFFLQDFFGALGKKNRKRYAQNCAGQKNQPATTLQQQREPAQTEERAESAWQNWNASKAESLGQPEKK